MQVTIIKPDNYIVVNGRGTNAVDLSAMPAGVRVLQWHDGKGEVELTEVGSITAGSIRSISRLRIFQRISR